MMKPSTKNGCVNILQDTGTLFNCELMSLNSISSVDQNFFSQLNGSFSAGFSYTKSSKIGQFSLSSNVLYVTRNFDYQLSASTNGTLLPRIHSAPPGLQPATWLTSATWN
jgi:hypothetical protein